MGLSSLPRMTLDGGDGGWTWRLPDKTKPHRSD
jgi:hypothetical protein